MKKSFCVISLSFALAIFALLSSCSEKMHERNIFIMDTVADIRVYSKDEEIVDKLCKKLGELDDVFSAYSGEVYALNENEGGAISKHVGDILSLSIGYQKATEGRFSPFLGSVIELWGIGSKNQIPEESEISKALESASENNFLMNENSISLENGVRLNFGAIAKGYAADELRKILCENDCESAVISLGGNVYVHGKKSNGDEWNVAIRDPLGNENDWVAYLELCDKFVVSSGDYERYFEHNGKRYHHIINPQTASPAESDLSSVTVICDNGAMADAYSTALYIMGKEKALEFWRKEKNFELVLIDKDGCVVVTEGVADKFTPNNAGGYNYETAKS